MSSRTLQEHVKRVPKKKYKKWSVMADPTGSENRYYQMCEFVVKRFV